MKPPIIIGIILTILAFVILGIFIVLPSALPIDSLPPLKSVLQMTLCQPGETLNAKRSEFDIPTTQIISTTFHCERADQGSSYDVSQKIIHIGLIGYLVPFLIGIFMISLSGAQWSKMKASGFNKYDSTQNTKNSHLNAANRLIELKTALNAGAIKQSEYDAKKKEILKEM